MLTVVLFCIIGLVFAGDGSGYNYPKPSIPFGEEVCPPGSNGVYPHCDHPQPQGRCATGYSGIFPDCQEPVTEKPKQCPPPTVGTYPNCIVPPCPPGFTGTYPDCDIPPNTGPGGYLPPPEPVTEEPKQCNPPTVGTYPNCIVPPCPPGFTGTFPNCEIPANTGPGGYLPPPEPVTEEPKQCTPPTVGTYPNCIVPPCPPGFTGTFPNCEIPANASAGGYLPPPPTGMCTLDWSQFKTTFGKTYADEAEESYRQQLFLHNQEIIVAHNALYEQGLETYSLCINKFGDWSHNEYAGINGIDLTQQVATDEDENDSSESEQRGAHGSVESSLDNGNDVDSSSFGSNAGSQQSARSSSGSSSIGSLQDETSNDSGKVPDSKDWRKEGAVTSVKDQMSCASCYAFSAAGALEGQFFLKDGVLESLSTQQMVDCTRPLFNMGCNTGFMTNVFLYTKKNGIRTEAEYPYEARDNQCRTSPNNKRNKKLKAIPKGDEGKLKEAVGTIGPISVALDALNDKFMFYSTGVYLDTNCDPEKVSHAVLAVGYDNDEATGLDYWIIKNSYGTTWGEEGYGKIARNKNNHCGIATLASYPIV